MNFFSQVWNENYIYNTRRSHALVRWWRWCWSTCVLVNGPISTDFKYKQRMSTRNRRNYSRNMYTSSSLYMYTMRDTKSTWERHCDILRTDKTVRVTEWITKQIEWRKYVTNGYNNNSTENSLSKRLDECVCVCVYRTERAQQNEHATQLGNVAEWTCEHKVVCDYSYMLASVYARDIFCTEKLGAKWTSTTETYIKARVYARPVSKCMYAVAMIKSINVLVSTVKCVSLAIWLRFPCRGDVNNAVSFYHETIAIWYKH